MKRAEEVTFGGAGLDRAAEIRSDENALARAWSDESARVLPVWRGKPLLESEAGRGGWLSPSDALVRSRRSRAVFLGRDDGAPRFAADVSDWDPEGVADTVGAFVDPSLQYHPDLPETLAFAELRGAMSLLTPREAELVATAKGVLGWHDTHGFCAACGAASEMIEGGWQRRCPACGTRHFPRTDPVVIMLVTHGNDVLVGRSPGWPEGMYSLLAGFIEPGETIEGAVRREVFEETGVRVGTVDYLASQPWPFPSSLMMGCAGLATTRDITIDPVELDDALWVSREDMMDIFAGQNPAIKPARRGAIARFLLHHWLADTLD